MWRNVRRNGGLERGGIENWELEMECGGKYDMRNGMVRSLLRIRAKLGMDLWYFRYRKMRVF